MMLEPHSSWVYIEGVHCGTLFRTDATITLDSNVGIDRIDSIECINFFTSLSLIV